ncbi:hypothetical protein HQN89_13580 [Paenibacillus frigoriresistens]|uniref:hypothetical protein n=1 Tax=Paenibacillus alginolyticus TaxID=59839 RepID=UPI001563DDFE|nr:hypothetical protein [Paenibacillus frigoriresistens]NRF92035.1 hypothetical protein [Paenibacillus frigoriresistens]
MEFKSKGHHLIKWLLLLVFASALCLSFFYRSYGFTQLILEPIISLETRHSGNGRFYETDDKSLIAKYQGAMESIKFRKKLLPVPAFTGGSSITLIDAKGVRHSILSGPGNTYSIDNVWYKANNSGTSDIAWKDFFQNFYNDANYVPQK